MQGRCKESAVLKKILKRRRRAGKVVKTGGMASNEDHRENSRVDLGMSGDQKSDCLQVTQDLVEMLFLR